MKMRVSRNFLKAWISAVLVVSCLSIVSAQSVVRVKLSSGAATQRGSVKGDQYVDYVVNAGAGQTLAVAMKATNGAAYFNVTPPSSMEAMFVGSSSGNSFSAMTPIGGGYTVRVYLMRSAGRRGESSKYSLNVRLSGKGLAPLKASADAMVPGTQYHASTEVACTYYLDPKIKTCPAFVIRREGSGNATVELRPMKGTVRRILFMNGKPVASDSTQKMTFSKSGDITKVRFGQDESYEIVEAIVYGG